MTGRLPRLLRAAMIGGGAAVLSMLSAMPFYGSNGVPWWAWMFGTFGGVGLGWLIYD